MTSSAMPIKMYLANTLHLPLERIEFDESTGICRNIPFNKITVNELGLYITGLAAPAESRQHLNDDNSLEAFLCDQSNALVQRFFRRVVVENPAKLAAIKDRSVVYLANHQTGIESLLCMQVSHWLTQFPVSALAKDKHKESSYGLILNISRMSETETHPIDLVFVNRDSVAEMLASFNDIGKMLGNNERSVLIHVEGTRALQAGHQVQKFSAMNIDLAEKAGVPIVPVKFLGGLPRRYNTEKLEFPWQYGQQDCYFGEPIMPEELKAKMLKEKVDFVCQRINNLGPSADKEKSLDYDDTYENLVCRIADRYQLSEISSVFAIELQKLKNKSAASRQLIKNLTSFYKPEPFHDSRLELVAIELFGMDMSNGKDKPADD